ncbi:hypothetical protein [Micromonospora carbonacea]|uniref:hypothetical protein n=1 Tax=Micromonospora carbonacea TaxID=47853 RepID=UPI00371A05AB
MTATDELHVWLGQQITAAETRTRELLYWAQQTTLTLKDPKLLGKYIPGWHDWPAVERVCRERLAELDAQRRILELHAPRALPAAYSAVDKVMYRPAVTQCEHCDELCHSDSGLACDDPVDGLWPCPTVRTVAAAFSTEPGYRPEWSPQ